MKRTATWAGLAVAGVALFAGGGRADEAVRLRERFPGGHQYHVRTRVEVSGTLTPPPVKGKASGPVKVEGTSAIDYDERVLALTRGEVSKTVRVFTKLDFQRTLAGRKQQIALRPAVARMVMLRRGHTEVPFSPDGPLTWGELDVLRTDVFVPGLTGLFPDKAVKAGDRWSADSASVEELTDLEKVEDGKLECKLERVSEVGKRRLARVTFSGTVTGVGEDGPVRHQLKGHYVYDLTSDYLSELTLNGTAVLLDKDKKEVGKITGRFALTREPAVKAKGLSDAELKGVKLEPDASNTLMLYENAALGVRLTHPRRWRLAQTTGPQVALDAGDGGGLLITVDPPARVPTAQAFQVEASGWLTKQKAKVVKSYAPKRLRAAPALDAFALEVEAGKAKFWMDYYVTAQGNGGATLAARLAPGDGLAEARKEVEQIARSVVITKKITGK
jgi:hypothetical protein